MSFALYPSFSFRKLSRLGLTLVMLLALGAAPVSTAQSNLPQLGDGQDMTVAAEARLGQRIARELYRDPDYLDDAVLMDYVQRIWQPLLQAARARGDITTETSERFAWQVLLGRDRSINAFALPGGYFGLHLGLIAVVGNRDELASVLAHEISHVTQRHIARITSQQSQQAPWVLAGVILGVLAARKNADAANAILTGSQAASVQSQLNFSRDMEREADRIGYQVLQDAKFNVQGFVGMFDKLSAANRINDNGSFPYLRTHPLTSERIGDMQSRMQMDAPQRIPATQAQALEHALIATRARLLSDPSVDVLRNELRQASSVLAAVDVNKEAASDMLAAAKLYGGALAALKQRDFAVAHSYAQAALLQAGAPPSGTLPYARRTIGLLLAEIALAQNDAPRAREIVRGLMAQGKDQRPVLLMWAQTASLPGAPEADRQDAASQLQVWIAQNPNDAAAWEAAGNVYNAMGKPLRALRSQAEARVALLDYTAALDRFKAGQELARSTGSRDHIELSIIDSRARAVQALVRELHADKATN
jgi:predicted Zn-dependent protease